jgi:hypothetical protein
MALSRVHICFRDASCRLRAAFVKNLSEEKPPAKLVE